MSARRTPRSTFSRLTHVSRSAQVRDQLEAAIRRGDYAVGDRLPSERELTELLGVSRVSVREAIRSLEAVGLVHVRHGDGCFVADPAERPGRELARWLDLHRDEVLDLLRVRGALDELAAEEAAGRRDPRELEAVRAAHEAFAEAVQRPGATVDELTALDVAFHTALARASGSALLANLLADLHEHLADSRRVGFHPRGRPPASAQEHAAIVEAVEAGRRAAARRAAAAHIENVRRTLAAELAE